MGRACDVECRRRNLLELLTALFVYDDGSLIDSDDILGDQMDGDEDVTLYLTLLSRLSGQAEHR